MLINVDIYELIFSLFKKIFSQNNDNWSIVYIEIDLYLYKVVYKFSASVIVPKIKIHIKGDYKIMNTQTDNKGQIRSNIPIGTTVDVVLKKDQRTTKLTRGIVKRLLTNSAVHPRGIKVMLEDGQVGRVQAIISK